MRGLALGLVIWISLTGLAAAALAETARVAVAANFRAPLEILAEAFEEETGHTVLISSGATGQLFAQITHGAPHDVFLAADQARPLAAVNSGHAVGGTAFTYAEGRLFVQTIQTGAMTSDDYETLRWAQRVAIANPRTAPYGRAAQQVIEAQGMTGFRVSQAQSIAGVSAALATGAVDAGFVAYAAVVQANPQPPGWLVPVELHDPIRQDAVLLRRGADNEAARAFLDWLRSPSTKAQIRDFGYHVD